MIHADAPEATPAVATRTVPAGGPSEPLQLGGLYGIDQPYRVVDRQGVVPRVFGRGVLVDLDYADRVAGGSPDLANAGQSEVWVGPHAPADLAARLTAAGLRIHDHATLAQQSATYEREGPPLALRLYLFAAVAALLLGIGAVVVTTYIGATARSDELAALRVAGVSPLTLRRSVRREYAVALWVAAAGGVLAGAVGAVAALPSVPTFTDPPKSLALPLYPGPWLLPAGLVGVAALLVLVVVVVASGLLRRAQPDRVRTGVL